MHTGEEGDKHFSYTFLHPGGTNIFTQHFYILGGGQTFYVGGSGGHDDVDVDEEVDMSEANLLLSEANILVSKAKKLSAGPK